MFQGILYFQLNLTSLVPGKTVKRVFASNIICKRIKIVASPLVTYGKLIEKL